MPAAPCRLFVYLARRAPLGVVLRRGPSRWSQLSVWHTDTDTFEHGQWMRGRIYQRRSDLSPDGSLFVYFVRKDGARSPDLKQVDSWVAISRPPWFTTLALWAVGGTYHLGGYFAGTRSVYVGGWTDRPDQGGLPAWLSLTSDLPHLDRSMNWTERTVYFSRLWRDGWEPVDADHSADIWQHRDPAGALTLTMSIESESDYRAYGGPNVVRYAVHGERLDQPIQLGRATWADWDHGGRLILARGGKLLHWQRGNVMTEILDFNSFIPDPAPSPAWARTWPVAGDH